MPERIKSIDITKGILIILVVIGHLPFSFSRIIYFFHMPAFFILSGLFLPVNENCTRGSLWKKVRPLAITYLTYLLLIGIPYTLFSNELPTVLLKLILGGRALTGPLSPMWFVSALAGGMVIYFAVNHIAKNRTLKIVIFITMYCLAHWESSIFKTAGNWLFYFPLAWDVSLLVAFYLFAGSLIKPFLLRIDGNLLLKTVVFLASAIISAAVVMGYLKGMIRYEMDMKYVVYHSLAGDIFISMAFLLAIFSLSSLLQWFSGWLAYTGKSSLTIMYLHMPVILIFSKFINIQSVWVISGIVVPVFLHFVFSKYKTTSLFLLGR